MIEHLKIVNLIYCMQSSSLKSHINSKKQKAHDWHNRCRNSYLTKSSAHSWGGAGDPLRKLRKKLEKKKKQGKQLITYLTVKDSVLPPKIKNKTWITALTFIQSCTGDSNKCNPARKGQNRHPDWRKETYLHMSLCRDDHLCRKSYRIQKLLKLTSKFSMVTR